jgi:hypothetical protein
LRKGQLQSTSTAESVKSDEKAQVLMNTCIKKDKSA